MTVPLLVPDAPFEMVSHAALLVAVHAHEAPAVTATEVVSPAAGEVLLAGAMA